MVIPIAHSLFLCDYVFGYESGKTDAYGFVNAIRPDVEYPLICPRFCVFAQLSNGLGKVPFFVDVRAGDTNELVHTTEVGTLFFPRRSTMVRMVRHIPDMKIERKGVYFVQLFCDNTWIGETRLLLL
ncbi:MAG: hypothetical protein U0793_23905 [Gemmataceae bacterium]